MEFYQPLIFNPMNQEQKVQVKKLVSDFVVDQITQMTEDMSSQDFLERVYDMIEQEGIKVDLDNSKTQNEIKSIVGNKVVPLMIKMTEYIIGREIPIK
jgi:hypothetical protein